MVEYNSFLNEFDKQLKNLSKEQLQYIYDETIVEIRMRDIKRRNHDTTVSK